MSEIKIDRRNYRKHSERNKSLINKSLSECGAGRSILIDNENSIVAGNGIFEQAQKLDIPIRVIETDGTELIAVKRTDLATDDEKRKQLAVMDNSTSDSSEFDMELLAEDFDVDTLSEFGVDVADFCLSDEAKEDDFDASEIPDDEKPLTKRGDVWILGNHRLLCGDSTKIEDVEKLINSEKVDMVFTDPPYGMGLDTDWSGAKSNPKFYKGKGCKETGNKYEQGVVDEFTPEIVNNLFACFSYVREIFLFGADYFAELLPNKNDGSWIVWDKRSNDDTNEEYINQADKMFGSCFELCWSKNKHRREIARVKWAGIFGTEKEFDHKRCHPTQKPTALARWFFERYSEANQLIVDLFGGSGSTLIACEQLNRKCYMMEIDEHYCDVIIRRWQKFTGADAVLESTSETFNDLEKRANDTADA